MRSQRATKGEFGWVSPELGGELASILLGSSSADSEVPGGGCQAGQHGRALRSMNSRTAEPHSSLQSAHTGQQTCRAGVSHGLSCLLEKGAPFISDYSIKNAHCRQDRKKQESTISHIPIQFSSAAQSYLILRPHGLQHIRLLFVSPTPGACLNSCPSNQYHPLLSPSPPTLNFSQHQGLFQWVGSSHQVAKVL